MPIRTIALPISGIDDHDSVALDEIYCANLRNVRSTRDRIDQAPGATLLAPAPMLAGADPGFGIRVGSFAMATATGDQVITHGLGANPKAIIFFTSGSVATSTTESNYHWGYGFTDLTTSRSVSFAAQTAVSPSNTSRRSSAKAISLCQWGEALIADGDVTAVTTTTMTVNWTTVDGNARMIGYVVLGGNNINAKVIEWTLNTSTGNQALATVGFTPQLVWHLLGDQNAAGTTATGKWGLGVMSAAAQWAVSDVTTDNSSISGGGNNPQRTGKIQKTDHCLIMGNFTPASTTGDYQAKFVSMDANGFTVNIDTAPASAKKVYSLAINGVQSVKVGSFNRTTAGAPVKQAVTAVGFKPNFLLLSSQDVTPPFPSSGGTVPLIQAGPARTLGVGDGMSMAHSVLRDNESMPTATNSQFRTDAILAQWRPGDGIIRNVGSLFSFDSDGFTLNWTQNDPLGAQIEVYVAIRYQTGGGVDALGVRSEERRVGKECRL